MNKVVDMFTVSSSPEQTKKLNELLHVNYPWFGIRDVFKFLPAEITVDGKRGDLFVSHINMAYFSFGGNWRCEYIISFGWEIEGTIYDAFIKMVEWLKENKLMD